MQNVDVNAILSSWSIFIQIMVEIPLLIILLLGWLTTKKRVMLLWTIGWILNILSLGFVLYAAKSFINNSKPFFNLFYESYGVLKISFAFLLLFSVYQYLKKERFIKFPFIYFLPSISILFILFTVLKAVIIQFIVYGSVSILFFWSALILFKYLKTNDGIVMAVGFLINGSVFLHHFFILVSRFLGKPVPAYMSRISFYDAISEFILALSFFLAITLCSIDELKLMNQKLSENQKILRGLVDFDPLTGLRNRRIMRDFIDNAKHRSGVIAFIDIDNFKMINDRFGHTFGDKCLVEISEGFKSVFRANDGLFRYGGDEFLLIIPNLTIKEVEKRLNKAVNKANDAITGINLTISYGLAEIDNDSDFKELLNKVDKKMYEIKKRHKNKSS